MSVYYNENDPRMAAWLTELIRKGLIAHGHVDDRSIKDVRSEELTGYTQCHFFAGIGVWSYSLRQSGWDDDRPVWTGSCPCQPFSVAGKQKGTDDERDLWPTFFGLIKSNNPEFVLGEQVASSAVIGKVRPTHAGKDSTDWIDVVQANLEEARYKFGAIVTPSAGVGAPHIRQRTWWMGHSKQSRLEGHSRNAGDIDKLGRKQAIKTGPTTETGISNRMADSEKEQRHRNRSIDATNREIATNDIDDGRLANGNSDGCNQAGKSVATQGSDGVERNGINYGSDKNNGFWASSDWLGCRDGKFRPVESGTSPLVDGPAQRMVRGSNSCAPIDAQKTTEARVMRLHGYGNAVNAESAKMFISCVMDVHNVSGAYR